MAGALCWHLACCDIISHGYGTMCQMKNIPLHKAVILTWNFIQLCLGLILSKWTMTGELEWVDHDFNPCLAKNSDLCLPLGSVLVCCLQLLMSTWKSRLRSSCSHTPERNMAENGDSNVITIETFTLNFLEALSDDTVIKKYQEILNPLFRPFNDALKAANQEISALKVQMAEKDASITSLNRRIAAIESHSDDLEQQGRKGSVRVFGVPEETSGSTDDKILQICNDNLGLDPPPDLRWPWGDPPSGQRREKERRWQCNPKATTNYCKVY